MSRARPQSRKFSTNSMLANQQSKLHRVQAQSGLFKPSKPFQFIPGSINATSFIFWLYLFSVMRTGIATTQNANPVTDEVITALARSRLAYEKKLPDAAIISGACESIVLEFGILAASNNAFRERAVAVLSQDDFKLVCADESKIAGDFNGAGALFHRKINAIVIAHDDLQQHYISHEMVHAYENRLHAKDGNCFVPYVQGSAESVVPFYPYNDANIKKFEDCMQKGDARVMNLVQLYQKKLAKEVLTQDEEFLLLRAKKGLETTTPMTVNKLVPLNLLQQFKNAGWPETKRIPAQISGQDVYVTKIIIKQDQLVLRYQIVEPIFSIHKSLSGFEANRAKNFFRSKQEELAERIAYSQQCLTRQGRRYLYPELNAFLEEQKKLCLAEKKKDMGKTEL
jgi:hypothetical protein